MSEQNDLRTALARYAHDQAWAGWMKYMFSKCKPMQNRELDEPEGLFIPFNFVQRWTRQMNTPFDELPEKECKSDFDEADKILKIIRNSAKPCTKCGSIDFGQTGEYPCAACGLPVAWDEESAS